MENGVDIFFYLGDWYYWVNNFGGVVVNVLWYIFVLDKLN